MLKRIRDFPRLVRKAVREGLGWSEAPPHSWSKRAAHYPLSKVYRIGKRIISRPRLCTYITQGIEADGKRPFKAAFVGAWQMDWEPALERFEQAIFQAGSAVRQEGGPFNGSLRQQAERLAGEVDLVLVAGNESSLWKPAGGNWVKGPAGLRRTYDFRTGGSWDAFLARLGPQSDIARVRESGLRYAITRRYSEFSIFLKEMYLPQMQLKKNGYGECMTEAGARQRFEERRTLLLVEDRQGQLVAGALMYPRYKVMHTCLRGVVYTDGQPVYELAQAAIDYFGLKWAFDSGCLRYESGLDLPFSMNVQNAPGANGLGHMMDDPLHTEQVLIWAPAGKQAGVEWLRAHPMEPRYAQAGGDELSGVYQGLRGQPALSLPLPQAIPNTSANTARQMEDFRFTIQARADREDARVIDHGLFEHALDAIGPEWGRKYEPFSILVHNQDGKIVGGLIGRITWNYMHIDSLWVSEELRGQHIGSRLMTLAERSARAEQVKVLLLETTSFEARTFYPKLGFEEVAEFKDVPPGHSFYIMKKVLD